MWRKVSDPYHKYSVSDKGQIRNDSTGKILSQHLARSGFELVSLSCGKQKTFYVHRLVALAFLPTVEGANCIDHLDGDRRNNHVGNLCWKKQKECRSKIYP